MSTEPPEGHAPGTTALGTPPGTPGEERPWTRLDPRVLLVVPLRQAVALVPLVAVLLVSGGRGGTPNRWALLAVLLVALSGLVRWWTVRYRVGPERVERRSGILRQERRVLARERVRTVDLRADLSHRIFGLTTVEIGTGSGAGRDGRLRLDGVTVAEAESLRRELLRRTPPTPAGVVPGPGGGDPEPPERAGRRPPDTGVELARLRGSWVRFAPFTGSGLVAVGAAVGAASRVVDDLGLSPAAAIAAAGDRFGAAPPWLAVAVAVAAVLVVSSLGSVALYLEGWWGLRVTREPDRTLRLRRGLLTARSLSIERSRLRGVAVTAPLPLRLAGGARAAAVSTGLRGDHGSRAMLLPPAPRAAVHRIAADVLGAPDADTTGAALTAHPPAALRRRLTRTLVPAAAAVAAAWWLTGQAPAVGWVWPAGLLVLPVAGLLGWDRYRGLGHHLGPGHLLIAQGSLVRRRVVLTHSGVIGWRVRQSVFQRRAGLVTLDAVTAAGAGRYPVVDVAPERAREIIDRITPGLSATRLDGAPVSGAGSRTSPA